MAGFFLALPAGLAALPFFAWPLRPAWAMPSASAWARSVRSQVNVFSLRPKCPYAAVAL